MLSVSQAVNLLLKKPYVFSNAKQKPSLLSYQTIIINSHGFEKPLKSWKKKLDAMMIDPNKHPSIPKFIANILSKFQKMDDKHCARISRRVYEDDYNHIKQTLIKHTRIELYSYVGIHMEHRVRDMLDDVNIICVGKRYEKKINDEITLFGYIDGIIEDTNTLLEIKVKKPDDIRDKMQVQLYMYLTGCETAKIVYYDLKERKLCERKVCEALDNLVESFI